MNATIILCDAAQATGGKLYILGGGWSQVTTAGPINLALAIKVDVDWGAADIEHSMLLRLVDPDGQVVAVPGPYGPQPVELGATFTVERPPAGTVASGSTLTAVQAISIGGLTLRPGRYIWQMEIDGAADERWSTPFEVHQP